MNTVEWPPRVGTWYLRWDKREVFQVVGYDEKSCKATIEDYDGNSSEIDAVAWGRLSLGLADPPEDWAGPLETVDVVDIGGGSLNTPVSEDVGAPAAPSAPASPSD